jgi:GNAT superfamily N-acetyltransferase
MESFKSFSEEPTIKIFSKSGQINIELLKNHIIIGEAILSFTADNTGIWLRHLFVEPEFRGKGYVKTLLNEVDKIAIEKQLPIYLRVWSSDLKVKSDEDLINMYKRFGFKQIPNKAIGTMVKYENNGR